MASSQVSWIEPADLSASDEALESGQLGPSALEQLDFDQIESDQVELDKIKSDQIVLIYDHSAAKAKVFEAWLKKHTVRSLYLHRVKLSSSRHFPDVKQPMLNK